MSLSSGLNVIVFSNWLILLFMIAGKFLQILLFGELRIIEVEHVYERIGYTLTTSLIALATFKNDNVLLSGSLAVFCLTTRIFHWILIDRIDSLFQVNDEHQLHDLKRIFLNRIILSTAFFLVVDYKFICYCIEHSYERSTDVYISFGFEVGMLFLDIVFNIAKAGINVAEIVYVLWHPQEEILESKGLYLQLTELAHGLSQVLINCLLFVIFLGPDHFPFHMIGSCWVSISKFYKKMTDFIHFLKNAKRLDNYLENAVEAELEGSNSLCIICREDMTTESIPTGHRLRPKKLKCNHIIHLGCLKSWLEISQLCPMCRAKVFDDDATARNTSLDTSTNTTIATAATAATAATTTTIATTENSVTQQSEQNNGSVSVLPSNLGSQSHFGETTRSDSRHREDDSTSVSMHDFFEDKYNSEFSGGVFRLPVNSLLPTDWTVLPLQVTGGETKVYLNDNDWAKFEIKDVNEESISTKTYTHKGKEKLNDPVAEDTATATTTATTATTASITANLEFSVDLKLSEMSKRIKDLEDALSELKQKHQTEQAKQTKPETQAA